MSDSMFAISRSTRAGQIAFVLGLIGIVIFALAPWWAGRADLRLFSEFFLYLSLASLWNWLAGYSGLVSVGQQAFVGFGGYVLFGATILLGVHPFAAIAMATVLGALIAMPVATLIFRLRGAYFAIGTWVVAEVFRLTFANWTALGGGSGTSLPVSVVKSISKSRFWRESISYWLAFGAAVLIIGIIYFVLRSRRGLGLTAIRDNEEAAAAMGVDTWRTKFLIYVMSSGLTAMVGAIIFLQKLRISPNAAFSVNDWTAFVIFIVVIGGIGTLEGPIIGTILFFLLRETLADLGTTYLILLGFVAILTMLFAPQGLWGLVRSRFGVEIFSFGYRVVPKNRKP